VRSIGAVHCVKTRRPFAPGNAARTPEAEQANASRASTATAAAVRTGPGYDRGVNAR
jgi:hypothetical protein